MIEGDRQFPMVLGLYCEFVFVVTLGFQHIRRRGWLELSRPVGHLPQLGHGGADRNDPAPIGLSSVKSRVQQSRAQCYY